jgi:predicted transcriptional regulator
MIIRVIAADGSVELAEPRNFKAFAITVVGGVDGPFDATELLKSFAVDSDREHAWVAERALRDWRGLAHEAWWQDGLTKMIASVEKFGWVDRARGAIRAHIEYLP